MNDHALFAATRCFCAAILLLLAGVLATGCGGSKVDASSKESAEESLKKVREELPPQKREQFDDAMRIIILKDVENLAGLAAGAANPDKILENLHGKTANEIIAEAERIKEERWEKQEAQIRLEITELREKQKRSELAKADLAKFKVVSSRFSKQKTFVGIEPHIDLAVRNETAYVISRVYFRGILATPGRAVPWLDEEFNYQIRGGLEPGEQATWNLVPNMFSEWGKVENREDMILTVEVVRLDGADETPLFSADFGERDAERLKALEQKLKDGR